MECTLVQYRCDGLEGAMYSVVPNFKIGPSLSGLMAKVDGRRYGEAEDDIMRLERKLERIAPLEMHEAVRLDKGQIITRVVTYSD